MRFRGGLLAVLIYFLGVFIVEFLNRFNGYFLQPHRAYIFAYLLATMATGLILLRNKR